MTAAVAISEEAPDPGLSPEELAEAERLYQAHLQMCRDDVHTFIEYVMTDEKGRQLEQADIHHEMQEAFDEHKNVVIMAHPESGKTNQFAVGRVLWELGRNPNLRLALINNTQAAAKKTLGAIKKYIEVSPSEQSRRLHEVFPALLPGEKWTEEFVTIQRPTISRDYTLQTVGYHGDIQGSRVDGAVVDDLLDFEVTRTERARKEMSSWWALSVESRFTDEAWVVFLTNAWHPEDLSHELEKSGWFTLRFPVYDEAGNPTWKEKWSVRRIEKKRARMPALEFARMFLCKARDDGAVVFLSEALEKCQKKGHGYELIPELDDVQLPEGAFIIHGVDIGASKRMRGGLSCIFTILIHPNGMRQPLSIRAGRWSGRQLIQQLADVGDCFGGIAVVEDNGVQKHLVEIAQEAGEDLGSISIPVLPFTTGKNKVDPILGIEGMAAEFESGKWVVPVGRAVKRHGNVYYLPNAEVRAWLSDMSVYDPEDHAGDRLMASWMARTYGMRLHKRWRWARRNGSEGAGGVRVRVVG